VGRFDRSGIVLFGLACGFFLFLFLFLFLFFFELAREAKIGWALEEEFLLWDLVSFGPTDVGGGEEGGVLWKFVAWQCGSVSASFG